jgi:hypothetical protein
MTFEGTPRVGKRIRRAQSALLSAFALTAGIIGATAGTGAAAPPPTNVGVTMTGAYAGVTNGLDQVLKVHAYATNVGNPLAVTLTLDTGGRVDTQGPAIPANCTNNGTGSSDVITCTWDGFLLSQTPQGGDFSVAVKTPAAPASSMTSTATIAGTLGAVPLVDDPSDNTATVVTALSATAPCGGSCTQGFVPQGGSISRTSPDGTISQTFSVPASANWTGGGEYVTLKERSTTGFNCGGQTCNSQMAEALFTPFNPSATPTAADLALKEVLTYQIPKICFEDESHGETEVMTCSPLYYTVTGQNSGTAPKAPSCPQSTAGDLHDTSSSPSIPCVAAVTPGPETLREATSSATYTVALLKDIGLPPLLPKK